MTLGVARFLRHVFSDCFNTEKPAKRGPKPEQIGPSDYCRIFGCCLYVDSTGQSSRSRKATGSYRELFFVIESVRQNVTKRKLADDLRDLDFTVSQTED